MKIQFIILLVIILTYVDPTSSEEVTFKIVNPLSHIEKSIKWKKLQGLPEFSPNIHSDGCSGGMSAFYKKMKFLHKKYGNKLSWRECCTIHDKAYYYGGSKAHKKRADIELNSCVSQIVGQKYLGKAMEIAVKIGGGPYLPTSFRWGYGEDFRDKD